MLGSSVGQIMLNDSSPPATRAIHDWYSKTLYRTLPLTAGFFCLVDERGANVPAAWRVNRVTSFSKSTSFVAEVDCFSSACRAKIPVQGADRQAISEGNHPFAVVQAQINWPETLQAHRTVVLIPLKLLVLGATCKQSAPVAVREPSPARTIQRRAGRAFSTYALLRAASFP